MTNNEQELNIIISGRSCEYRSIKQNGNGWKGEGSLNSEKTGPFVASLFHSRLNVQVHMYLNLIKQINQSDG